MSAEVLQSIVEGNPQAQQELQSLLEVNQKNVETISGLEKFKNKSENVLGEIKEDRDRIKSLVRRELGLEELTEEGIKQKIRSFGESDALSAIEKEYSNFKNDSYNEKQQLAQQIEELKNDMVKKDLTHKVMSTGIYGDLDSDIFSDMLTEWTLDGATLDENGEIAYISKDGTTMRNSRGDVMSLEDRISEIRNDPKRSKIFIEARTQGGGTPSGGRVVSGRAPSAEGLIRSKMNFEQKVAYRKEFGDDNYNKLPLA